MEDTDGLGTGAHSLKQMAGKDRDVAGRKSLLREEKNTLFNDHKH
jgi:hypothetical protein